MTTRKKIKSFEITREIGDGGMAHIYKARQPSLNRFVVLKKLKQPTPDLIKRFEREAVVAASFSQENIVSTYDFFKFGEDYYLVMEYINGMDLKTILSVMSPLSPTIAAMIVREVARGLEYAHDHHTIHRDIKPSNVMVSEQGEVKIIDFGLAKNESPNELTKTGVIVGTPTYLSPEQLNGEEITEQTDIYSLGVMFYELVTGFRPFTASTNTELFNLISQGKYRSPRVYDKKIPRWLTRIINRAMNRSAEKRYLFISDMIQDINKFLKWENQVNIKHRLSDTMKQITSLHANETMTMQRPEDHELPLPRPRPWKPVFAILLFLLLISSGGYLGFQEYAKNNLGGIALNINVSEGVVLKDDNREYKFKDGVIVFNKMLAGPHSFRISAGENFSIFEGVYQIKPDTVKTFDVTLIKQSERALLTINSEPNGAHVYINDQFWGKSPINKEKVTTGIHKIELIYPGYQNWKARKEFRINEDLHFFINMDKAGQNLFSKN